MGVTALKSKARCRSLSDVEHKYPIWVWYLYFIYNRFGLVINLLGTHYE